LAIDARFTLRVIVLTTLADRHFAGVLA